MKAYSHPMVTKSAFIAEIKAHAAADALVRGSYGYNDHKTGQFRGCAVGCAIVSISKLTEQSYEYGKYDEESAPLSTSDHNLYEDYLGVPTLLAKLEDYLFESLPYKEALEWPLKFSQAIKTGADLSQVWSKLAPWLLKKYALPLIPGKDNKLYRKLVQRVIDGYANNWTIDTAENLAKEIYQVVEDIDSPVIYEVLQASYAAAKSAQEVSERTSPYYAYDAINYIVDIWTEEHDDRDMIQQIAKKLLALIAAAPV